MPPLNNLPPFRAGAPFPPATRPGHWVNAPGSLKQLGQSLKVDEDRTDASYGSIIRAIPDPWAQAQTFADALLDEDHSMHSAAERQWRGLLALFALADLRKADYSLDVQAFKLGEAHPFDRLLRHLAPQTAVEGNSELWKNPHIVYLYPKRGKAVPVALLNPASLVSPGRTTWRLPFEFIPWLKNGLDDPLKLQGDQKLANTHLASLEAYLSNLAEHLPRTGDRVGAALREGIYRFAQDVATARGPSSVRASVKRSPDSAVPAIYQQLLLPAELEAPSDAAAVSECRLQLVDGQIAPLSGVLLIDESVAAGLGKAARDVLAWGNHSLAELLGSPHALEDVRRAAAERGWVVATADDLFTARLVKLRKDPKIEGHPPELQDLLEPIRPLALLLEQTGTRRMTVDRAERRVTVNLHAKLQGAGPNVAIAVGRTYRPDEPTASLVDEVDWDFGQASVWPNFRSKNWALYLARFSYPTTREQIRPQFALSREILLGAISSSPSAPHAVQAVLDINLGQAPAEKEDWFRRFQNVAGKAYEELQISDRPFEAIFYVDYHPDRGESQAGCVRLKLDEPVARDNKATVAIDFGSTNTVACISSRPSEPMSLQGRIVHPIIFQEANRADQWKHIVRWNYVDFLPLSDRPTPTPTVVISRNDPDRNADLWLLRHLVYFQPAGSHAKEGAADEIKKLESYLKRSKFNLKWDERPDHIDAPADFLEQFMTMIAAEAAANEYNPKLIDWRFSVPDAMHESRLRRFRSQVEVARQKLSPAGSLDELYSEGLAAARYILSGREGSKFTQGSVNVILDIGGSTTDITIWSNDRLVWKGSFRLAGRAFFTQAIVQNPQLLREIELDDWADLIDPAKPDRVPEENVADVGELLFSRPALSEAFEKHWNRRVNMKPGEALRATALVYLSGIAYYIGLVTKKLVQDGTLQSNDLERPAFALCGRGAGIFDRMHGGLAADAESQVTLSLRVFSQSADAPNLPRPQLFISRRPKLEVAAGMLVDFETIDARVGNGIPQSSYTPTGMSITLSDGTVVGAEAEVGANLGIAKCKGSSLSELDAFLEALEDVAGIEINLKKGAGQGASNEIGTILRQKIDRQKTEEGYLELREPPFITALAALVDILARPTAERNSRLAIEVTT